MSQCKHGTVSWADCTVCKTERIAELEAENIRLRNCWICAQCGKTHVKPRAALEGNTDGS